MNCYKMAKKSTVVLLLLVVGLLATNLTDNVYAQDSWEIGVVSGPTKVLVKGGLGSSNLDAFQKDYFSAGLSVNYELNNRFRLSGGILYEKKGTNNYLRVRNEVRERLEYLSFPLLVEFSPFKTIPLHAGAGVSIGYLLDEKRQMLNSRLLGGETNFVEYKKVNVGPIFEIGTKLPITNEVKVSVNLQHQIGVTNVLEYINDTGQIDGAKMQTTGVMIGFRYGLN